MESRVCTKCGPPAQPIENFPWKSKLLGKRHAVCKTCTAKRSGDWYEDNKDRQLEYVRNNNQKYRQTAREYVWEYLSSHPCTICGEADPVVLEFHHNGNKDTEVSRLIGRGASLEAIKRLEAANHQLAEYASQAEELAITQERNRLARDIHDNLGHFLTIVNVQIEAAKVTFDSDPERAWDSLNKVQEIAQKGLSSVRESVSALRVSPLENRPLQEAISALVDETGTIGLTAKFDIFGEPRCVDEKVALALYRAAQEGLTNVRKHAQASQVNVLLDFTQADKIRLTVEDDGAGAADTSGGFGLIGIRERLHLLGGDCHIETEIDNGFCLEVIVPVFEEELV